MEINSKIKTDRGHPLQHYLRCPCKNHSKEKNAI